MNRSTISRSTTSDIIYYNIVMTGNPNIPLTQAIYEEIRTQPVIDNPSEYYLSVVRFSIDGDIPIFICPVIPNPLNPLDVNYTPFAITLSYGGVNYTSNLIYIPSTDAPAPQVPTSTTQDVTSTYYYIYYYTTFVQMINNAINTAFSALILANPGLSPNVEAPYFQYEPDSRVISYVTQNIDNPLIPGTNIYMTQFGVNGKPIVSPQPNGTIYVYVNDKLLTYVDGIENFEYRLSNKNLILVRDLKNNYYYPPINGLDNIATQSKISFTAITDTYSASPKWFKLTQQYNMISKWNSLSNIVFLTNNLPVNKEFIPASSIIGVTSQSNTSFRQILTDFCPILENAGDSRSRFNYFPQGPYRLIELNSTDSIRVIDLRIFWEDHLQNLYPLFITYGSCNNIKLMFIKKSLVKSNNQIAY